MWEDTRGEERGMAQGEKRSFWDRLFGRNQPSAREERVVEYIIHRLGDGAEFKDRWGVGKG